MFLKKASKPQGCLSQSIVSKLFQFRIKKMKAIANGPPLAKQIQYLSVLTGHTGSLGQGRAEGKKDG